MANMRPTESAQRPGIFRLGLSVILAGLLAGCAGQPPAGLGSAARGLAPCPDSPNCVSSQADEPRQRVPPLQFQRPAAATHAAVVAVVREWPRARVTLEEPGYVRSEFTSRWLGFVDDVEFWWADGGVVHVRSASRLGYSDFGVNRERVESLREAIRERLQ